MNIKKQLKDSAKQVLPDEKVKDEIKYRIGIDSAEEEVELGGMRAKLAKHKIIIAAAACLLAAIILVCAFIPLMTGRNPSSPPVTPPIDDVFGELSSAEEVYGFSAATAGMMISGMNNGASAAATGKRGMTAKTFAAQIDDEQTINTLNGYMALVESLISGESFTVKGGKNVDGQYDYDYVMSVTYTDFLGQTRDSGTIYYNRTHESTEHDGDESETTYTLEGIMVLGENEYPLRGTHQSESEDGESENEYEMRVYLGDNSYILVEQSHENEGNESEIEYCYTVTENGRRVSRTTFEYESEHDETELLMTVEESGRPAEVFSFESEDGEILIRLGGTGGSVAYTVRIIDGQYVYYRGENEIDRGDRD